MASADYTVLTPERVSLQYDIAGVGSRGAAAVVDTAIQAVALLVVFAALAGGAAASGVDPAGFNTVASTLLIALFVLPVFVVTTGYFMLFETLWSGQTPGKRLVGVRVMRENGYPIRPVDAVIRNLIRIVDWLPGILWRRRAGHAPEPALEAARRLCQRDHCRPRRVARAGAPLTPRSLTHAVTPFRTPMRRWSATSCCAAPPCTRGPAWILPNGSRRRSPGATVCRSLASPRRSSNR